MSHGTYLVESPYYCHTTIVHIAMTTSSSTGLDCLTEYNKEKNFTVGFDSQGLLVLRRGGKVELMLKLSSEDNSSPAPKEAKLALKSVSYLEEAEERSVHQCQWETEV